MILDDIKYLADTLMIEKGFEPIQHELASINLDCAALWYKCTNLKCKKPYELLLIAGIAMMQYRGDNLPVFMGARCKAKALAHKCD